MFRSKIVSFFSEGHQRTQIVKKNIVYSLLLRGCTIGIGFLLIPITIRYLSPVQYGVWLTMSSIISWINFFDIGLGNGLKNKLAATNALKIYTESKSLVSTTYSILSIISFTIFLVFFILNSFINWSTILNIADQNYNYSHVAILLFGLFCIQLVVQTINAVLTACHLVAKVSLIILIGQVASLIGIIILIKFTHSSLFLLVLVNAGVPIVIYVLASIWYYKTLLLSYAPSFALINLKQARDLLSLGGVFFFIQLGALVLFQTDNIVIVQLFGPVYVTTFNIAYKLFSVFVLILHIMISPFWSAFTDAYVKNDLEWIKSIILKMKYMWLVISVSAVILYFLSPAIYKLWIGKSVKVPVSLSLAMTFYIIVYTWQTIHVYFLNGINKIRLQLYLVVVSSVVNIPLAIFLGKKIGLAGITIANASLFLIMGISFSFQTKKILNMTAKGLLNS